MERHPPALGITENSRAWILETKKIEKGKIWKNFTMGATL
jgi:hypothetical protein